MKRTRVFLPVVGLVLLLATASPSLAQGTAGVRVGVYTDQSDLFVGGELLFPVASRLYINPNVEWVFVENGTYMTFNLDGHLDIYPRGTSAFLWFGGGLAIIYRKPEGAGSNADTGLNLLGGLGWRTGSGIIPYVQLKLIVKDGTQGVVGIGLRF
jgi:hypothetical protein